MPAFFIPAPEPGAAPDPARAAALARVRRTPELAPYADLVTSFADAPDVDWRWLAEAPLADAVTFCNGLALIRYGRPWPEAED
jgi:hypothetical protein